MQLPHLTFQTGATGALSDMDSAGDPAVAFGPHNTVYYANLVFSRLNNGSGVVVSKSSDGGLTWGEPSIVHTRRRRCKRQSTRYDLLQRQGVDYSRSADRHCVCDLDVFRPVGLAHSGIPFRRRGQDLVGCRWR